jgi:hypothetical protein
MIKLKNQKNKASLHTKLGSLNSTCFLDDPKLKPVSYSSILKNWVLIYGHKKGELSFLVKMMLWVIFFLVALGAIYSIKKIFAGI